MALETSLTNESSFKMCTVYYTCAYMLYICIKLYGGAQIKVLIMVPYRSEMRKPLVQRTHFMAVQLFKSLLQGAHNFII